MDNCAAELRQPHRYTVKPSVIQHAESIARAAHGQAGQRRRSYGVAEDRPPLPGYHHDSTQSEILPCPSGSHWMP